MRLAILWGVLCSCAGPLPQTFYPAPLIPVGPSETYRCAAPGLPSVQVVGAEPEAVFAGDVRLTCHLVPLPESHVDRR